MTSPLPPGGPTDPALQRAMQMQARQQGGVQEGVTSAGAEAAEQFESLLVQQLWQTMRKTVSGAGFGGGGAGADTYMHFMDEAIATSMTEAGGIGLRDVMTQAMGIASPRSFGEDEGPMVPLPPNSFQARSMEAYGRTGRPRQAPLVLGPATGQRIHGATGRLQDAATQLLQGPSATRFGRDGRLTRAELASDFATDGPGGRAAFNVHDAAGFEGEYKCNLFAFEMARRAGFQTPVQGRRHGWGYPSPDAVTADAAGGRLRQDWGRVATGESQGQIDGDLTKGRRAFMLSASGTEGHAGHMAVVERVHSVRYDDDGQVEQVVFDGWEARSAGARHLTQRTWNRRGIRGGNDVRGGLGRIEIIELLAPPSGAAEVPITESAGPSRHD